MTTRIYGDFPQYVFYTNDNTKQASLIVYNQT